MLKIGTSWLLLKLQTLRLLKHNEGKGRQWNGLKLTSLYMQSFKLMKNKEHCWEFSKWLSLNEE